MICYTTVRYKTVCYTMVYSKMVRYKTVQRNKTVQLHNCTYIVIKSTCYKRLHKNGTVTKWSVAKQYTDILVYYIICYTIFKKVILHERALNQ
jgi:hypothetical protein